MPDIDRCGCESSDESPILRRHWKNGFKTGFLCRRCGRKWGGEVDLGYVPNIEGVRELSPELARRLEKEEQ